jgi:hypothetical protein
MKKRTKIPIGIFYNGSFYKSFPTFAKENLNKTEQQTIYMAFYRAREKGEPSIEFTHNNKTYIMKNI